MTTHRHTYSCLLPGPSGRIICKVLGEGVVCRSTGQKRQAKLIAVESISLAPFGPFGTDKTFKKFEDANRAVNGERGRLLNWNLSTKTARVVVTWANGDKRAFMLVMHPGKPIHRPIQKNLSEKILPEGPSFQRAYAFGP